MKFVVFFALVALATAAKLPGDEQNVVVIEDLRDGPVGAIYNNRLELDNGVVIEESGSEGSAGQSNSQGSFSFISPEGIPVQISFFADEGGFQPSGDAVPVPHPNPPHVEELLRIAEQQRAEGIEFDERGFRI